VAQYEKAIQSAFREVADALAGRATLGEQLRRSRHRPPPRPTASAWPTCATATAWPATSTCSMPSAPCFATQQALAQSQLAQRQNQVALYKALGGGAAVPPA
jgi:multidrug efflux system outer membrane protein